MWQYNYTTCSDELYHFGVPGMKWGHRKDKTSYRSTGIRAKIAKRKNDKVDKSFKEWNENVKKRDNAIDLGKKATAAKRAYESDKQNKDLKSAYKQANKDYKKALKQNTTYRKGVVKQEVGRDSARKYLSDAKKVKKQLSQDPSNKKLQKQYNSLMSKHDVERAKARRATEVSANRSRKKASIKRAMTMSVATVAGTAAVTAGVYAANRYLSNHKVTLNGSPLRVNSDQFRRYADTARRIFEVRNYI